MVSGFGMATSINKDALKTILSHGVSVQCHVDTQGCDWFIVSQNGRFDRKNLSSLFWPFVKINLRLEQAVEAHDGALIMDGLELGCLQLGRLHIVHEVVDHASRVLQIFGKVRPGFELDWGIEEGLFHGPLIMPIASEGGKPVNGYCGY